MSEPKEFSGVQVRVNYEVREMESTCTPVHPFGYFKFGPTEITELGVFDLASNPILKSVPTIRLPPSSVVDIPT